ncbi:MAG: sulfurtransferase [Brachybacterium sp.]|uniref:sulfurtransferase n=1 Tax=Brachybacterium sp. TaxID=1891286 RepID=UPI00264A455E|nr:sulfurtransferase [Brachybacterium sp.]MDN5687819.1 sulfurtransferase [Brachybacterium sp.]
MAPAALAPIIDVSQLRELLERDPSADEGALHLLDVRWALDGSTGHHTYLAGHLPGAVYVDLDTELAAPARTGAGRHPLPAPEDFAASLRRAGVTAGSRVVAYDDTTGAPAGRLVWMLRALGHDAAVLDGGLTSWDGELATDEVRPTEGDVPARAWPVTEIADADEVASGSSLVIDARAPERYRGDVEPVDPRAGHIPGAVNLPFTGNLGEDGAFLTPEELRGRFEAAGVEPEQEAIVYCGSGVTAAHDVLALQRAGFHRVRLFPGSWSQWSADPARPVATGATP